MARSSLYSNRMRANARTRDVEKGDQGVFEAQAQAQAQSKCFSFQAHHNHAVQWMGFLSDDVPLSSLTIPGTHDSASFTTSLPFVSTQKLDILDQLNAGIRYFDLRCAIRDDVVEMVHGPQYLGITLERVLDAMYVWLGAHSTEALVVQIKRDRTGERSSMHMSQGVFNLLAKNPDRWRTENTNPLLGELRGRIQLFRRFSDENLTSLGIDVTGWQDNRLRPFTLYRNGFQITIQDHYSFPDPVPLPSLIAEKGGNVSGLLNRASSDSDPNHWYINFTSAYEFNFFYQLTPRSIAVGGWHRFRWENGMNVLLRGSLKQMEGKRKRFGIIVMDFPELGAGDLIPAVIQSNFDLETQRVRLVPAISLLLLICLLLLLFNVCGGVEHASIRCVYSVVSFPRTVDWRLP